MKITPNVIFLVVVSILALCALEMLSRCLRTHHEPDFFEDAVLAVCCGFLFGLLFFI